MRVLLHLPGSYPPKLCSFGYEHYPCQKIIVPFWAIFASCRAQIVCFVTYLVQWEDFCPELRVQPYQILSLGDVNGHSLVWRSSEWGMAISYKCGYSMEPCINIKIRKNMMLSMDGMARRLAQGAWSGKLKRLIPGINLLLIVVLAYTLAGLSWQVMPEVTFPDEILPSAVGPVSIAQKSNRPALGPVAALHLFGEASEEAPAITPSAPVNAPETRLSLTLRGVVAIATGAVALIASGSAEEQIYKVGDALPGGAKLHEVQADRVILERGGRFETLTLPKDANSSSAGAGTPVSKDRGMMPGGVTGRGAPELRAMRDQLVQNPQEAFNLVRAQPVMDGDSLKGYRIMPGRERALFNGTGLRPGDVVTRINGLPLNDPTQVGQLFEQLKSSNRFDVVVERGGRETQLTVDLGQ